MLRIYSDLTFTKTVKTIEWNNQQIIKLVTGEEVIFSNTAKEGDIAEAKFYIRNESLYPFFITKISLSESRLNWKISKARLNPNDFTELSISFKIPENITPADVIKAGIISIEGYYLYGV